MGALLGSYRAMGRETEDDPSMAKLYFNKE
jgi:hypothetical protein